MRAIIRSIYIRKSNRHMPNRKGNTVKKSSKDSDSETNINNNVESNTKTDKCVNSDYSCNDKTKNDTNNNTNIRHNDDDDVSGGNSEKLCSNSINDLITPGAPPRTSSPISAANTDPIWANTPVLDPVCFYKGD